MGIAKNDFVEIFFTGKITNTGEIFDTNIEKDAKLANMKTDGIKPLIVPVGQKMLPEGLDKNIIGKTTGEKYEVKLKAEEAFGKRDPTLIRMIPSKYLHAQKINPVRGMQIALDGKIVKVLSSDRGRTLLDFNNPLAGKAVIYSYRINRMVTEEKEKVNALQELLFKRIFDFEILNKKVTFNVPKEYEAFVKMFIPKLKEIIGLEISIKVEEKDSPSIPPHK